MEAYFLDEEDEKTKIETLLIPVIVVLIYYRQKMVFM